VGVEDTLRGVFLMEQRDGEGSYISPGDGLVYSKV
jgi:hypothetical protein